MEVILSIVSLTVAIAISLQVEGVKKIWAFVLLGIATTLALTLIGGGDVAKTTWEHEFPVSMALVVLTLAIVATNGFRLRVAEGVGLGWHLVILLPLGSNIFTSIAVAPILLGLYHEIKRAHPDNWLKIMIISAAFSMNGLAIVSATADVPVAKLFIDAAGSDQYLNGYKPGFFFMIKEFWEFWLATLLLYVLALKLCGVKFPFSFDVVKKTKVESPKRFLEATVLSVALVTGIIMMHGHDLMIFYFVVVTGYCLYAFLLNKDRGHDLAVFWDNAKETLATFAAFYPAGAAISYTLTKFKIGSTIVVSMVAATVTSTSDNLIAFEATKVAAMDIGGIETLLVNSLFPSVIFGAATPLGHAGAIMLFLVILGKKIKPKDVWMQWLGIGTVLIMWNILWMFYY